MNKFYPKRFKRREDGSIYLENVEPASQYVRKMTDKLCACQDEETLLAVKKGHSERLPALNESLIFPAPEDQIMGKMYDLFVREKLLDDTADNRMILVGKGKRMNRTLGSMIRSAFAEKEISAEYLELLKDMFGRKKLNIRNGIMHGLGESCDYLSIAIVAVMFQVLWDIADGSIWR